MHSKLLILLSLIFSLSAYNTVLAANNAAKLNAEEAQQYWTKEKMRNAKELTISEAKLIAEPLSGAIIHQKPFFGDGSPPTIKIKASAKKLFQPIIRAYQESSFDRGTLNQSFSSTQIVPGTSDSLYPYRAIGKLFFTIPGKGNFTCSASVIQNRIVLTAGHCVHSGTSAGFYTNFSFVPAFNNGTAPVGTWTPTFVTATSQWISGGGTLPNASDIGMLEIADRTINGVVTKIGDATGFLGWQTSSLANNHVHSFGYPNNLDSGTLMHQVAAQSGVAVSPNNIQIGSDMQAGSDGGPWIQNFGIAAVGQSSGSNAGINRVVGVTSVTASPATQLGQSSSILDSNFISLLSTICAHQANNCTTTPSNTNLALMKPTTASTEFSSGFTAPMATDGDVNNSRWCAIDGTNGQWLKVDLGATFNLTGTQVKWESNGVWQYKIEVSLDGNQWTQVVDRTSNNTAAQIYNDSFASSGRFVRITATTNQPGHFASIFDFQVFGG